ncbi:uncharacterized protein LOC121834299 [Ixodes scapularis]|uniref:uncharacterized protein LOC121834299 n=1 Tax=Ixodes scapularis TaxID=6945 RepID=UPI001C383035|nr:uncharacterized protein LOC121834299 [Ixodes scapularis]
MSSVGAGAAAAGRGNRNMASAEQDYQVILPTLPTGTTILNTAFLHADVTMRPYRLEHFRDALVGLALLPEVLALGAYQYNHVWAVTFKSVEGKKKLLAAGDFTVKEGRCVVVDPSNQDTRLKLHWLLHHVPDDEVRVALAPYGKVTEVARDVWRAQGCAGMLSTTRSVSIRLKAGLTVDSLPHQLRVAGDLALVVVPGRAPLCLRCRGKGHIRRECRVPRCALCRRFGHEDSQCIRTYASVTGPVGNEDTSELLMDVVESQEAAGGEGGEPPTEATPTGLSAGDRADSGNDALVGLALLPEVVALGAYQYNHVWAVTFKSVEGKKKLLAAGDFTVKEGRCVVVDPSNQDTRLKLHWLLHHVPDDEVRVALAPYGKVTEVARDVWRAQGCAGMLSTTRSVSIRLKAGLTVDSLPHQLRVAGDLALVVVPGRAPLCLRCRGKGHIRRECRVPRCALCRRFGHEDSQCIRTYASVTGPVGNEDTSELLMDVVESQEAAGGEGGEPPTEATPTGLSAGDRADSGNDAAPKSDSCASGKPQA